MEIIFEIYGHCCRNLLKIFYKFLGNFWKILWTFNDNVVEIYGKF